MYKLFVNGIQIGNYKSLKIMMKVAFDMEVVKNGVRSANWISEKEFSIKTN